VTGSAAARGGPGVDAFLTGVVFLDVIFTGLPGPPAAGTEVFAAGLGTAPGGSANLAVALRRLGRSVGLGATFSTDMFGSYLWRILSEQEGIDLSWSLRQPDWPTPVTVSLSHDGDRSMITYQEPLPAGPAAAAVPDPPPAACFVHLGNPVPDWAVRLRQAGTTVFADVSWDPSGAWSPAVLDRLSGVDVFCANAVEAMAYTRTGSVRAALDVLAPLVPVCVVKDGSRGAVGVDNATGERASEPAIPVELLDPTGAGGVFDAGFAFGTLAGWPLAHRLRFANLCAGLSVRHHSGSLGAPCWGEIADWLADPAVPEKIRAAYFFIDPYVPASAADDAARASPTPREPA
jgi:sugar/nucleoside kinase (ribokinase family)